jgi:hypothetical protein
VRCPRPVVNGVLLKPLPYADGEQFVALYSASFNQPEQRGAHRFPDLVEYDLDCWLRRAREASPSHVEEIETLVGMKARMAVALRARDEMLGVLVLGAPRAATATPPKSGWRCGSVRSSSC